MAKSYNNKGYTLNYERNCRSNTYFNKALDAIKNQQVEHVLTKARVYHNYGNFYNDQYDLHCETQIILPDILAYYNLSLNIYLEFSNPSRIALNEYVRSVAYQRDGQIWQGIELLSKSINTYGSANKKNETMLDVASSRLALHLGKNSVDFDSLDWAYNFMRNYIQEFIQEKQSNLAFEEDLFLSSYYLNSGSECVKWGLDLFNETGDSTYLTEVMQLSSVLKYPRTPRSQNQIRLDSLTVVIDYYTAYNNSIAIVYTHSSVEVFSLIDGSKLTTIIKDYERIRTENNAQEQNMILNALYNALIDPISQKVKLNGKKLVIIPDFNLEFIDFASLNTDISESTDFRNLPFLINECDIRYGLSISLLNSDSSTIPISRTVLISDPLDSSLIFSKNLTNDLAERYRTNPKDERSEKEVLHLAGHVIPDYDYHELSKIPALSMLDSTQLSQSAMQNVEMLVIQGCKGADGQLVYSEGRYSFNRLFQNLGVKSVVSSKWDIDDKYSSILLRNFYEELEKSYPKSKALVNAQKRFIANAKSSLEAHPRNWAGIVIYGNDSPISIAKKNYLLNKQWYYLFIAVPFLLFLGKRMRDRHKDYQGRQQSV